MRLYRGFGALPRDFGPAVVAMGNFDGVHLGHRSVLDATVGEARRRGVLAVAVSFHPHPLRILDPGRAPVQIQSLADRLGGLAAAGLDAVVLVPFTRILADVEATAFVTDFLAARLRCAQLHVGADARFGRGRQGDIAMLRRFASDGVLDVRIADAVLVDGVRVSSSEVRRRVVAGDVAGAERLLGRRFSLAGEVVRGAARGRQLGFPTANVLPDAAIRPEPGVYAAAASGPGFRRPAAVHVGPIPTFGIADPVVEAHLVGFEGDLVGERIRLEFVRRLRGIVRFDGPDALKARIGADVAETIAAVGPIDGSG